MRSSLFAALSGAAAGIGRVSAIQVGGFSIGPDEAKQYDCGALCYGQLEKANTQDHALYGLDYGSFYETASNFSTSLQPGELLKIELQDPSIVQITPGIAVHKIQYTTKDLDGSVIPATGYVALPDASVLVAEAGGARLPVAAWAHGTTGLNTGCAPSNGPQLVDFGSWEPLSLLGYAVVTTDYAGLGNNHTSHKYTSFQAQANDIYYAVQAARKAFGNILTREWISIGHSQGGGSVWKLAESPLVQDAATGYLGTVALAPPAHIIDMAIINFKDYPMPAISATLTLAIKRAVPSYNETCLTETMRKRVELQTAAQVCNTGIGAVALGFSHEQTMTEEGIKRDLPTLLEWQAKTAPALGDASSKPVLIVQGQQDDIVLWKFTQEAYEVSCAAGNELHLRLYSTATHATIPQQAQVYYLPWIGNLFAEAGVNASTALNGTTLLTGSGSGAGLNEKVVSNSTAVREASRTRCSKVVL